jgi:hypothetical protein
VHTWTWSEVHLSSAPLAAVNRARDQRKKNIRRVLWARGFVMVTLLGTTFGAAGRGDMGIKIAERASGPQAGKASASAPANQDSASLIPTILLQKIPLRATNTDGRPGDVINILIVGAEADITLVFRAADWTAVDRTKAEAASSAEPSTNLSKEEYLALPLPEEFLFGKSQDYGFAQDALVTVVKARHDVRIWKAPFTVNGQTLWVGVAAHEGPWWDNSAGTVNDGPDPNVDDERDFVGNSLRATGLVKRSGYVASAGESGNTTHAPSDGVRTDGRLFVMMLLHL